MTLINYSNLKYLGKEINPFNGQTFLILKNKEYNMRISSLRFIKDLSSIQNDIVYSIKNNLNEDLEELLVQHMAMLEIRETILSGEN